MQAIVYLSMISILLLGLPKFEVSSIHATWVIVRGSCFKPSSPGLLCYLFVHDILIFLLRLFPDIKNLVCLEKCSSNLIVYSWP